MALGELLLQRPGDSIGVESVSWTCGARLELPGSHMWSLTPQNKAPRHVCPLGPGPAFLIPQPCRDQAFFFFLTSPFLSTLSHLLTYLRIGPRALWAVAGPTSFATCLPSAGPGLSSGAVLRSTSFPPPWGSSPEHPSYILRSQEAGEPQKRLGGLTMASSSWSTRVYMCVISVRLFHLCRPFSEPGDLF